jgi:dUTP pyrophosphatase
MEGRNEINVSIKKLSEHATTPTLGSAFAAGADVYASHDCVIPANGRAIGECETRLVFSSQVNSFLTVPTDLALAFDNWNYYLQIAPRSGLAVKNGIDVGAGIVDYDYRGAVGVVRVKTRTPR